MALSFLVPNSSSSVVLDSFEHEVFLSFRGEDTRNGITSHLYDTLNWEKILVFIDDNLERGEEISSSLLTTIEKSILSIVIFSKNYASSSWCLDELVHIMKCREERNHIVFPVFYGVNPSDVRKQKGGYDVASFKHYKDKPKKVQQWRKALTDAANLSGYPLESKTESQLVKTIVDEVLNKLSNIDNISNSTHNELTPLIGVDKHLQNMESLLCFDSSNVLVIGIWGMGGIGKTTLAEAVYKRFSSQFEDHEFFRDVGEDQPEVLEDKLFTKLFGYKYKYANKRLCRKKVLLVFDNITDLKQSEYLLGSLQFGAGSRILVTSRDKGLLKRTDKTYEVKALEFKEAFELFCWKAFKKSSPLTNLLELSKKVVEYAQGNPLALHVLGSFLHSRPKEEWESTLIKLEKAPDEQVHNVLKISYDALDDHTKTVFLDIACCLNWEDRDTVEGVMGDDYHIGISLLIEKSLITIENFKLGMHDLLREMAWRIVQKEPKELRQECGRLYIAQDVYDVLKNKKGTPIIELIYLDTSKMHQDICLESDVFREMCNLRLLKITCGTGCSDNCNSKLIEVSKSGLTYLPNSLRYLAWSHCPLRSPPSNFMPSNLVELNMRFSNLKELWNGIVHLGNLKEIDLSDSKELIKLPDLSQAPKLQIIDLNRCKHLNSLPELPINITDLYLRECHMIESLPSNIWKLKSLESLDLYNCSRLKILPEISEVMEHLHYLYLEGSGIEELPSSIENITGLEMLILDNCQNLNFIPNCLSTLSHLSDLGLCGFKLGYVLPSIQDLNLSSLDLSYCNIEEIPYWIGSLSSLRTLQLIGNSFKSIPSSISQLDKLSILYVNDCKRLQHLPELPSCVQIVEASGCTSLQIVDTSKVLPSRIADPSKVLPSGFLMTNEFNFCNCWEMEQSARDSLLNYFLSRVYYFYKAISTEDKSFWGDTFRVETCYPSDKIPNWFSNRGEGSAVTVHLLPNWNNNNFWGFATCLILEFDDYFDFEDGLTISTKLRFKGNYDEGYRDSDVSLDSICFELMRSSFVRSDHVFMWHTYDLNTDFHLMNQAVEASFDFVIPTNVIKVKKCGVRMIYSQELVEKWPISQEDSTVEDEHCGTETTNFDTQGSQPSGTETKHIDICGYLLFLSIVIALSKAAGGSASDGGNITTTASDGSRLLSVESPAVLGNSLPSLKLAPQPNHSNLSTPSNLNVGKDSEKNLEECPNSQEDPTVAGRLICQDLTLSTGSYSEERITPVCHYCSNTELQRLGNIPNSDHSTNVKGLCLNSSLSSNSNDDEGNNGCLISELLEEPKLVTDQPQQRGTETINSDAEELSIQRTKHFDICGCLPFLSIIIEWKGRKN